MGGLLDWLGTLIREDSRHNTHFRIPSTQILLENKKEIAARSEENYIRFRLTEMFLRENYKWFTHRYPLVYSLVELVVKIRRMSPRR